MVGSTKAGAFDIPCLQGSKDAVLSDPFPDKGNFTDDKAFKTAKHEWFARRAPKEKFLEHRDECITFMFLSDSDIEMPARDHPDREHVEKEVIRRLFDEKRSKLPFLMRVYNTIMDRESHSGNNSWYRRLIWKYCKFEFVKGPKEVAEVSNEGGQRQRRAIKSTQRKKTAKKNRSTQRKSKLDSGTDSEIGNTDAEYTPRPSRSRRPAAVQDNAAEQEANTEDDLSEEEDSPQSSGCQEGEEDVPLPQAPHIKRPRTSKGGKTSLKARGSCTVRIRGLEAAWGKKGSDSQASREAIPVPRRLATAEGMRGSRADVGGGVNGELDDQPAASMIYNSAASSQRLPSASSDIRRTRQLQGGEGERSFEQRVGCGLSEDPEQANGLFRSLDKMPVHRLQVNWKSTIVAWERQSQQATLGRAGHANGGYDPFTSDALQSAGLHIQVGAISPEALRRSPSTGGLASSQSGYQQPAHLPLHGDPSTGGPSSSHQSGYQQPAHLRATMTTAPLHSPRYSQGAAYSHHTGSQPLSPPKSYAARQGDFYATSMDDREAQAFPKQHSSTGFAQSEEASQQPRNSRSLFCPNSSTRLAAELTIQHGWGESGGGGRGPIQQGSFLQKYVRMPEGRPQGSQQSWHSGLSTISSLGRQLAAQVDQAGYGGSTTEVTQANGTAFADSANDQGASFQDDSLAHGVGLEDFRSPDGAARPEAALRLPTAGNSASQLASRPSHTANSSHNRHSNTYGDSSQGMRIGHSGHIAHLQAHALRPHAPQRNSSVFVSGHNRSLSDGLPNSTLAPHPQSGTHIPPPSALPHESLQAPNRTHKVPETPEGTLTPQSGSLDMLEFVNALLKSDGVSSDGDFQA